VLPSVQRDRYNADQSPDARIHYGGTTEVSANTSRGMWSSRAGFILAAAGSAVGLGNIWGFPTQVGQGGGAAFVVVYLACILLICAPIMAGEIALGRRTRLSPVGSFALLAPGGPWWLVGALGVLAGVGILSFYSVIAGWAVAYVWFTATGAVSGTPDDIGRFFAEFTGNGLVSSLLALLVIGTTAAVLLGGVRTGIERVTKALMPLLVLLLIALALRAVTLPGAGAGLAYYLSPDLSRMADVEVFTSALGQAFFSLSLGMGCILTYGSYFSRQDGIAASALWIVLLDTSIALLAGFIIFPVGFSIAGFDPTSSGPASAAQPKVIARGDRCISSAGVGSGSGLTGGAGRGGRLKAIFPEVVRPKMAARRDGRSSGMSETWINAPPSRRGEKTSTFVGSLSPT